MSLRTGLSWAIGLPLAALLWYPDWLAPAAIVGGLVLLVAITDAPGRAESTARARRTVPVESIRHWVPGVGVGVNPLTWRPSLWLTLWRRR